MANHVTSEWEDIHVKLGNYVPTEVPKESLDKLEEVAREVIANYDPLDHKNIDELDELEDKEDEEVLRKYKEKRLREMKEFASRPHYGQVREFSRQDYIKEVNQAPKGVYVVIHLYIAGKQDCVILDHIFENLAKRFVLVKFLRIEAHRCVDGFNDKSAPGVLIYKDGEQLKQMFPATHYFGGSGKITEQKVEWYLAMMKVLKTELDEDPFEGEDSGFFNLHIEKKKEREKEDYESDDEDENGYKKGKEYGFNFIRK